MSADASSSQKPIAPLEVLSTDGSQKQSPQIISTGKEEDICDDWEQLDQNVTLIIINPKENVKN